MPSSVESSPAHRVTVTSTAATTTAAGTAATFRDLIPIPLIYDSLTFDARQENWIKDLERKVSVPCFCTSNLVLYDTIRYVLYGYRYNVRDIYASETNF